MSALPEDFVAVLVPDPADEDVPLEDVVVSLIFLLQINSVELEFPHYPKLGKEGSKARGNEFFSRSTMHTMRVVGVGEKSASSATVSQIGCKRAGQLNCI